MRRPHLSLADSAYGPIGEKAKFSLRNAPPTFGLGLLEAVPEEEILAAAGDHGGRPNRVWDIEAGAMRLGRFGLKANQPSLKQQIANAFVEDIGIDQRAIPKGKLHAAPNRLPRRDARRRTVGPATRRNGGLRSPARGSGAARRDREDVKRGEARFAALGCATCHRETMTLGPFAPLPALSGGRIHPYGDLLLHDMGEGLADGREDFDAGPRDWRTPPLWGLGLAGKYGDTANYLHDGRARTLAEAILWHGGEALASAEGFLPG